MRLEQTLVLEEHQTGTVKISEIRQEIESVDVGLDGVTGHVCVQGLV